MQFTCNKSFDSQNILIMIDLAIVYRISRVKTSPTLMLWDKMIMKTIHDSISNIHFMTRSLMPKKRREPSKCLGVLVLTQYIHRQ